MALDFPNSPNTGDVFTGTNSVVYIYDGVRWTGTGTASSPNGYTGSAGVNGTNGFTGSRGLTGFAGSQGLAGYTGSRGVGYTGSGGYTGSAGIGFTGSKGDAGAAGYTGSVGIGFAGSRGFTGSAGFNGSQGTLGFTGSKGDTGYAGSKGDIGYTGSEGTAGQQGNRGYTGSEGPQGNPGLQGLTGAQGINIVLVGSTTTVTTSTVGFGTAGQGWINTTDGDVYFWNTGTQLWENIGPIVGPQGDLGYTGSKGDQGNIGLTGDRGYTGSKGNNGYDGSQGTTGYAGSKGDIGYVGSKGDVGYVGSQGNAGYAGSKGDIGYVGSKGDVGYVGSKGDKGDQGEAGGNANTGNFIFTASQVSVSNDGDITVVTNDNTWTFAADGTLTFPSGNMTMGTLDGTEIIRGSTGTQIGVLSQGIGGASVLEWIDNYEDASSVAAVVVNSLFANTGSVQIITGNVGPTPEYSWTFGSTGTLTLPQGGTIGETTNTTVITPPGALAGQGLVIRTTVGGGLQTTDTFTPGGTVTVTFADNGSYFATGGYINFGSESNTWTYTITGISQADLGSPLTGLFLGENWTSPGNPTNSITFNIPAQSQGTGFTITLDKVITDPPYRLGGVLLDSNGRNSLTIGSVTADPEISHVHLTTANPSTVDLYLGDDDQYVKIEKNNGNVVIGTTNFSGSPTLYSSWIFDTDGKLTVPDDIQDANGSVVRVATTSTAPTRVDGQLWFNSEEGRTYIKYNGQWLDASPTIVPPPSTYLDEITIDGSTINMNGSTLAINTAGVLLVNGEEVTGSGWQLTSGTSVVSLNEVGELTLPEGGVISNNYGVIRLRPAGSNSTQALLIYPTQQDGDHVHLTAGGGNTDLYLGDDSQYVKVDHSGTIVVQTYSTATTSTWTFGTDGVLTLPNGGTIFDSGPGGGWLAIAPANAGIGQALVLYPTQQDGNHIHLTANGNNTDLYLGTDEQYVKVDHSGTVVIGTYSTATTTSTWTFGVNGVLTLSTASTILGNSTDPNVYIETSTTATTSTWTFGTNGILTLPAATPVIRGGGTGTDVTVIATTGSNTATWVFGATGGLKFPNNTVQTTAWLGGGSSSLSTNDTASNNFNTGNFTNQYNLDIEYTAFTGDYGVNFDITYQKPLDSTKGVTVGAIETPLIMSTGTVILKTDISSSTSTWTFGTDSTLTFPDSTIQTTAWTPSNISQNVTFTGNVTFNNTATYVSSTNTVYTDNILEIHAPPGGLPGNWTLNDGKDIGLRFHYYDGTSTNAALYMDNGDWRLKWAINAVETGTQFVHSGFGDIEARTFYGNVVSTGTVTATTFIGNLTGTATTASYATSFNTSTLVTAAVSATTAVSLYNGGYTLRSVAVPGNLAGSAGDTVGDIASDGTNLYYCTVSSTQTNYFGVTAGGGAGTKFVNLLKSGYNGPSAPVAGMIVTQRGTSHTITSVTDQSTYWQLNYSASEAGSTWGAGETVTITTAPAVGNIWKTVPWNAVSTSTTSTLTISNTSASTSTTTGALVVTGGVGIGGGLVAGGTVTATTFVGNLTGTASTATYATSFNTSTLVANAVNAQTVTTAAQPNITSLGTLTGLTVNGSVTATTFIGNLTGTASTATYATSFNTSTLVSSAVSAQTVTTAAQPNITSLGTLTSLSVSGTITATGTASSGKMLVGKTSNDVNNFGTQVYGTGTYTNGLQLTYGGVGSAAMWVPAVNTLAFGADNSSGITELMRLTSTGLTATASAGTTATTSAALGYLGMPQYPTATSYTLVAGDQGKHVYVTATGQTITVPSNATTAFPIGTTIAIIAGPSATTVTISITTDTMYLGGTGTTGNRTLAAYGMATLVKVAATTWFISGAGLT